MNDQPSKIRGLYLKKVLFFAGLASIFSLLWLRLAHLQVIEGKYYTALADENRYYSESIVPDRAVILDRYGQPLVVNKRRYFSLDSIQSLYASKRPIAREEALQLMATASAQVGHTNDRWYPYGEATAPILGYVGLASADDLKQNPELPLNEVVGKLGLEKVFDEKLIGQRGERTVEINALGLRQRVVSFRPAQPSEPLKTTLDPWISQVAYQAFGNQRGAAIVTDASSGAILALVSHPSFDANLLSTTPVDSVAITIRNQQLKEAFANPLQLFFNRASSGVYPPGSVFKIVTALAGLQENAITPDTIVDDQGTLKVVEYEYRNWYFTQYGRTEGPINLARALARSNDIYFYKTAEWVGPDKIAEVAKEFGLGEAPGTQLLSEAAGTVPDPIWKEKTLGERWYLGNTYHLGIGQDNLLVSPLQISQVIQTAANQGRRCRPQLLFDAKPECWELGVESTNWDVIAQGLLGACSAGGTAFPFFPRNTELVKPEMAVGDALTAGAVACKTGTAEFGSANEKGYRKTHAWFVAMVEPKITDLPPTTEIIDPTVTSTTLVDLARKMDRQTWTKQVAKNGFPRRITITVMVESDEEQPFKEGSREAAPIAKKILDWIEKGEQPIPITE